MFQTHKTGWSIRRIFSAPIAFFLSMVMSNHTKRLFYFASLYGTMLTPEQLQCDIVGRLNHAMNLARSDNALMVPAVFSRVVWGQDEVAKILEQPTSQTEEEVRLRAFVLVKMARIWLRFGSVEEMRKETERFLRCIPPVPAAA